MLKEIEIKNSSNCVINVTGLDNGKLIIEIEDTKSLLTRKKHNNTLDG